MARGPSPLLGYNTNIRHEGKLYHIQTEDSGVGNPHIITHLFADGGRIVATRKSDYREHLGAENLEEIVRGMMKAQHKEMALALRDRIFDPYEPETDAGPAGAPAADKPATEPAAKSAATGQQQSDFNEDTLERAARARMASSDLWKSVPRVRGITGPAVAAAPPPGGETQGALAAGAAAEPEPPEGQQPEPAARQPEQKPAKTKSIFGNDQAEEMSLDEVILAYIQDEPDK